MFWISELFVDLNFLFIYNEFIINTIGIKHLRMMGGILIDINTRQLRYFMELAKCLNFTKAAMNLYLAQPALSQQIADLEKQLGVTLFERNSRSVILTPAGEILQSACPEILAKLENIEQQMLRAKAGLRGSIKIGYTVVFQPVLARVLCEFRQLYPDIAVDICSGRVKELKSAMENGDVDVAFAWVNSRELPSKRSPSYNVLWQEDLCVVVHKDHPFALSNGTDYSLLNDDVFIMTDDVQDLGFRGFVQEVANEVGISIKRQTLSRQFDTIIMQVEAKMGVSILPGWMKSYTFCVSENIKYIPIKEKCMDFGVLWHEDSKNAAIPLFMDLLENTLSSRANNDGEIDLT